MNGIQVTLLILGSATLSVVATQLFLPTPIQTAPSSRVDLSTIEGRLTALEERPIALRQISTPIERDPVSTSLFSQGEFESLVARVAELETQSRPMKLANATPGQDASSRAKRRVEIPPAVHQQTILDARKSEAEKLSAHAALRRVENGYDGATVNELIRIAQTSATSATRADVWRQFDGKSHLPQIVPAMLDALARDQVSNVREEAAETLQNYLNNPSVRQALLFAANNDADSGVRRQAQESLDVTRR